MIQENDQMLNYDTLTTRNLLLLDSSSPIRAFGCSNYQYYMASKQHIQCSLYFLHTRVAQLVNAILLVVS